jgi:hypothetical protein
MKKIILGLLATIALVLIGAVVYVSMNLNGLIVDAVETVGPEITKTDVQLGSSSVSIFSGKGSLDDLVIANPKGYKAPTALQLGSLQVVLDLESVTTDTILINSIDVVEPEITYEPGGSAGSNLKQLERNAKSSARSANSSGGDSGPKVIIDRLTIRDGSINIVTPLSAEGISTPMPLIEITDIGRKKGGASMEDVMKLVMEKVASQASLASAGPLSNLKAPSIKGVTEGVTDGVGGVGDKVKGLFGK